MLRLIVLIIVSATFSLSYKFADQKCRARSVSQHYRYTKSSMAVRLKRDGESGKRPIKPFKQTGSHTYASWKAPKEEKEDEDEDEEFEDVEDQSFRNQYDEDDSDEYDSGEDVTERSESPFLSAMRKLYDAVFFYGLEPLPAASKKLKRKLNMDLSGSSSPFFTPSEQRIQRYLSQSFREVEQPELATKRRRSSSASSSSDDDIKTPYTQPQRNSERAPTQAVVNKTYSSEQQLLKSKSAAAAPSIRDLIRRLEDNLSILKEELEVVDAEIVTASALSQKAVTSSSDSRKELMALKQRRDDLLDEIEGIEVEIVDAKLKLKNNA